MLGSATLQKTAVSWTNAKTRSVAAMVRTIIKININLKKKLFPGNLCEHECNSESDCIENGYPCSFTEGYSCACEESLCTYERDPVPTDLE